MRPCRVPPACQPADAAAASRPPRCFAGKWHNRALGMSMRVEKSTAEQVGSVVGGRRRAVCCRWCLPSTPLARTSHPWFDRPSPLPYPLPLPAPPAHLPTLGPRAVGRGEKEEGGRHQQRGRLRARRWVHTRLRCREAASGSFRPLLQPCCSGAPPPCCLLPRAAAGTAGGKQAGALVHAC